MSLNETTFFHTIVSENWEKATLQNLCKSSLLQSFHFSYVKNVFLTFNLKVK